MSYQHILLIDDDVDDQEIFLAALQYAPGDPTCAAYIDAREALSKLKAEAVKPDVIFLDINMPVMNGIQFLKEIKLSEKLKEIPVIMFSTSADMETIKETERLSAKYFITKPCDFDDLKEILKIVLQGSWECDTFLFSASKINA